jgi:hypothetical protein
LKNAINAGYNVSSASGFVEKILFTQRRKMFDAFTAFQQDGARRDTVLNVGVTSPTPADGADYLVAWTDPQHRARITSCQIQAPPVSTRTHDRPVAELRLPFADGAFDWTFCNEVIERTGSFERQFALIKELARVSRKGVFLTTSNRRHPIEFNTALPFLHWLPRPWWRRLLAWSGKQEWASDSALTLLSAPVLYKFASLLPGKPEHDVGHKRVLGIKAHFFLMIRKDA